MPRRKGVTFPPYPRRPHRSGAARIRVPGRQPPDVYLGPHGSPDSHARYSQEYARWQAARAAGLPPPGLADEVLLAELAARFLAHAERHYVREDGSQTPEVRAYRLALAVLLRLYGDAEAGKFGPRDLKAVRAEMVTMGWARPTVNQAVGRLVRVFKWGAGEELVSVTTWQALKAVPGLQRGRTEAREPEPVQPVALELVEATLPLLPPIVAAMVRTQLLTGMRPGELVVMRPAEIDRTSLQVEGSPVWVYRPKQHKGAWRGHGKAIVLGPQAQAVLQPYLERDPEAYLFSPAESRRQYDAARRAARKTKRQPSQLARRPKEGGRHRPGNRYSIRTYHGAIERTCKRHGLEHWHPGQLRHSAATLIRRQYDLDSARAVLGHSDSQTTLIYAERDMRKAAEIAAKLG